MVNIIGIYGVLLSTVVSTLIVGMPWLIHNLSKEVFKISLDKYVVQLIKYTACVTILIAICYYLTNFVKNVSVVSLILKGCICLLVFNVLFIILNYRKKEFNDTIVLLKKMFKIKKGDCI